MSDDQDEAVIADGALEELSPREINRVMIRVQRLRHAKVTEIRNLMLARDKAEAAAVKAFAKAFLEAEGEPMDLRRQVAEMAAADLQIRRRTRRFRSRLPQVYGRPRRRLGNLPQR